MAPSLQSGNRVEDNFAFYEVNGAAIPHETNTRTQTLHGEGAASVSFGA